MSEGATSSASLSCLSIHHPHIHTRFTSLAKHRLDAPSCPRGRTPPLAYSVLTFGMLCVLLRLCFFPLHIVRGVNSAAVSCLRHADDNDSTKTAAGCTHQKSYMVVVCKLACLPGLCWSWLKADTVVVPELCRRSPVRLCVGVWRVCGCCSTDLSTLFRVSCVRTRSFQNIFSRQRQLPCCLDFTLSESL